LANVITLLVDTTTGQLQRVQDGDVLLADGLDRKSSSGNIAIGAGVTGAGEDITIGSALSATGEVQLASAAGLTRVMGDLIIDGQMDAALDMGASAITNVSNLEIDSGGELRLFNPANTFYTGFEAPALAASQIYVLPLADGTSGQVLTTAGGGGGVLSWTTAAGTGDVVGPAGGTTAGDIALYADTTGKLIQDSVVNIDGSGNIDGLNTISLNLLGTPPAHGEGLVWYDSSAHALVAYNDISTTTQQLGQEVYLRVYNDTVSQIDDGSAVYISGVDTGRPTIALAQADAYATAYAIGLATHDIGASSEGFVTTFGGVSADTSTYSAGNQLYVSPTVAGALTTTAPVDGDIRVEIGRALDSAVSGRIHVNPHGLPLDSSKSLNVPGDITSSTDGSTISPVAPRIIGFTDLTATESGRFQFGDDANGLQNGFDQAMQLYAYHTLILIGDREVAAGTPPAFVAGATYDYGVLVDNTQDTNIGLVVRGDTGQSVSLQEWHTSADAVLVAITETGSIEMGGTATAGDINLPDEGMIRSYGGGAARVVARVEGSALFVGENGAAAATGAVVAVDIEAGTNVDISLTTSDTLVWSFQAAAILAYTDLDFNNNDIVDLKTATFEAEYAFDGTSTLDWNDGQKQGRTLTASVGITTFTPVTGGVGNYILRITQAAATAYTITFPAAVQWPGGTAPTMTATFDATDIFAFYYDGSTWYGVASQNFS